MSTSVRDVAERAGVSLGTVSNVLNHPEKVSQATIDLVTRVIDELGFVRNEAARQLRAGKSNTIGFVVLDVRNPFFTEVARGAEDRAAEAGLSVILGNSDDSPAKESGYIDLFEQQRVHGVLVSPIGDATARLAQLKKLGTPAVIVDRNAAGSGFSSVSVDDVAGGELAVKHLLEQGRRRIAFVGAQFEIKQVADRITGAQKAIEAFSDATLEVITCEGMTVQDGRQAGESLVALPAEQRPDGIFAVNDLVAVGLLQAFVMASTVRVPQDISLVGYDDIDFASAAVVPLTTVSKPSHLIGSTAVDILIQEAQNPDAEAQTIEFQPELIVRSSS